MSSYVGTIYKGRTWSIQVQWLMDGVPVNLTGYTLLFNLKISDGSTWEYPLSSPSNGITITDVVNGKFTIKINKEDSGNFPERVLHFEVVGTIGVDAYTVFLGSLDVVRPGGANL